MSDEEAPEPTRDASGRLNPAYIAWLRRNFDLDQDTAAILDIEENGGLRFEDIIDEVERIALGGEPPSRP